MEKINVSCLSILFLLCSCLLFVPQASEAATAKKTMPTNPLAGVKIHIFAKQGDEWFIAKTKEIDKNGVLMFKNVLSGWGRIELAGDANIKQRNAAYAGQTFTSKFKLLDERGRRIKEATPVDLYVKINGIKSFLATMKTDNKGWITLPGGMLNVESYIHARGDGEPLSKNDNQPRIQVKAKMEDGDWFKVFQDRLDNKVLTMRNARPGKTKFNYVGSDGDKISGADLIDSLNQAGKLSDKLGEKFKTSDFAGKTIKKPFTLRVQVLDDEGHSINKPTTVKMTVYLKNRTLRGKMKTDSNGWLTIKGVPVDVETKMEVKD